MSENQKKIWITGASSGIGKSVAQKFSAEGWKVAVSARRKEILNEILKEILKGKGLITKQDFSFFEILEPTGKINLNKEFLTPQNIIEIFEDWLNSVLIFFKLAWSS